MNVGEVLSSSSLTFIILKFEEEFYAYSCSQEEQLVTQYKLKILLLQTDLSMN